jgi:hypothetical protein
MDFVEKAARAAQKLRDEAAARPPYVHAPEQESNECLRAKIAQWCEEMGIADLKMPRIWSVNRGHDDYESWNAESEPVTIRGIRFTFRTINSYNELQVMAIIPVKKKPARWSRSNRPPYSVGGEARTPEELGEVILQAIEYGGKVKGWRR